jgi:hypothetical protein
MAEKRRVDGSVGVMAQGFGKSESSIGTLFFRGGFTTNFINVREILPAYYHRLCGKTRDAPHGFSFDDIQLTTPNEETKLDWKTLRSYRFIYKFSCGRKIVFDGIRFLKMGKAQRGKSYTTRQVDFAAKSRRETCPLPACNRIS